MKKSVKKFFGIFLAITMVLQIIFVPVAFSGELRKPYANHTIPGIIKAADLDSGPEGNAYMPGGKNGSAYRSDVNVGIYDIKGQPSVSLEPGKWMRYTVTVLEDGLYDIYVTECSPHTTKTMELSFLADPDVVTGPVPATTGWDDLTKNKFGQRYMKKGVYTMQLTWLTGGSTFYSMEFVKASGEDEKAIAYEEAYRKFVLPTVIQAEEFDKGLSGAYSVDGINDPKVFRSEDVIDVYNNSADGYYISLSNGEYTNYTFISDKDGVYDFALATNAGICDAEIYIDNYEYSIPVSFNTDDTNNLFSIYLPRGKHKVKLLSKTDGAAIDYIRVTNSKSATYINLQDLEKPYVKAEEKEETPEDITKIYKELYVSLDGNDKAAGTKEAPFATIKKAQEKAREYSANMDGNIVINISAGYHNLDETILLSEKDSGKNGYNIIYRGASENESIIGSGVEVKEWEKTEGALWKAYVPELKETRRLSINGYAASRARSKYVYKIVDQFINPDSDYVLDGFYFEAGNFPEVEHSEDLEMVFDYLWVCQRFPLDKIERVGDKIKVHVKQPSLGIAKTTNYQTIQPVIESTVSFENAKELVDEPGEFFFDEREKMIYYYPYEQENMETAECYAGGDLVELVKIEGSDERNKVSNVIFEKLSFKHTSWNEISEMGYASKQAEDRYVEYNGGNVTTKSLNYFPPVSFGVTKTKNIQIKDCKFEGLGTTAVWLFDGVENAKVVGNVFKDCGGSGVSVGHWSQREAAYDRANPEGRSFCKKIDITNNVIYRIADDIRAGVGINVYVGKDVNILHNDIKDVPYSGMSIGWVWKVHDLDTSNFDVGYNRVENVTQHQVDGGHIYTLGSLKNSKIHDNYFVGADDYRGGIYHDSGSSFFEVYRNVISNVDLWWHCYASAVHQDINAYNNFVDTPNYQDDPDENCLATNTMVTDGGRWNKEAQDIIAKAGVEDEYKSLLSEVEYPEWRKAPLYQLTKKQFVSKYNLWVEAENWNKGPEGVGFHKELGGRPTIQSSGRVVGVTWPGDWLKYDVEIPEDGMYKLEIKSLDGHEPEADPCKVNIWIDDELLVDGFILKRMDWSTFLLNDLGEYYLTAGKHTVRVDIVSKEWAFDAFRFINTNNTEVKADADYDEGKIVPVVNNEFTDIKGHWANRSINEMKAKGVVGGVGANRFNPDDTATVYQMIWMTQRYFGIVGSDDDWKQKALDIGMLKSLDEADATLTKERMADIVAKAYLYYFSLENYEPRREIDYADFDSISEEYQLSARIIRDWWLISADENGNFNPKNTVTRAEAANILSRYDDVSTNGQKPATW